MMSAADRSAELRKVREYLRNAERAIASLGIHARVAHKYPFDIVAMAMLSKAFALAKACLRLLSSNQPDEAHSLSRILASIFGPISTPSWKAHTKTGCPSFCNVMWEEPLNAFGDQPMRSSARYTRPAFELGHLLTSWRN